MVKKEQKTLKKADILYLCVVIIGGITAYFTKNIRGFIFIFVAATGAYTSYGLIKNRKEAKNGN